MTHIAEQVGMHKSTVHRLLATLERKHFVQRDPQTGVYRPGIRLVQLAYLSLENNNLRQVTTPHMRRLWDEVRETIDLCVLVDNEVLFLDVIESPQRLKIAAAPGQRLPSFCTASGKALLAYLPESTVQRMLERGLAPYTSCTLTSPEELFKDLHLARERGFAISVQEYEEGINAVAAPILDSNHQPIAAIAIAGPTNRLTYDRMLEIGPLILNAVHEISKELVLELEPRANQGE
jgi:DNA-binding IclR family transcriptional regulator